MPGGTVGDSQILLHIWTTLTPILSAVDTGILPVNNGHYVQLDDNGSTKCSGFDLNSLDQDGHYHANCDPGYVFAFTTNLRHAWYGYGSASFQWDTDYSEGDSDCDACHESPSGTHCMKCHHRQFEDHLFGC